VHGRAFGADAAAGTLLGLCALATFVVVYGRVSAFLGPAASVVCVLAVFTHAHGGPTQVRVLLRNFLVGFYGFAGFCCVLAIGLDRLGTGAAFLMAIAAAAGVQMAVFVVRSKRWARAEAEPALERAG
jgi:hypothetical protein